MNYDPFVYSVDIRGNVFIFRQSTVTKERRNIDPKLAAPWAEMLAMDKCLSRLRSIETVGEA